MRLQCCGDEGSSTGTHYENYQLLLLWVRGLPLAKGQRERLLISRILDGILFKCFVGSIFQRVSQWLQGPLQPIEIVKFQFCNFRVQIFTDIWFVAKVAQILPIKGTEAAAGLIGDVRGE